MFVSTLRLVALIALALIWTSHAEARRVALVIGQNAYTGLSSLPNPKNDATRMAALLARHGFDVISCDGKQPGCFDQTRAGLLKALTKLEVAAGGADLALVFYAGHGMETELGQYPRASRCRGRLQDLAGLTRCPD